MGNLVNPSQQITIVQKDGECKLHLTIDVNINVNNGVVSLTTDQVKEVEDKTAWTIPEFSKAEKIKFGNKKEG